MSNEPQVINTKLPSYLKVFLHECGPIQLVYAEKRQNELLSLKVSSINNGNDVDDTLSQSNILDLTGNPLKIDLGQDEDDERDTVIAPSIRPNNWTSEEAQFIPITVTQARTFVNNFNKSKKDSMIPIYCICDGNDNQQTVIVGSHMSNRKWMRTLVYILPPVADVDEETIIDIVKKDHIKNVTKNTEITVSTRKYYQFLGCNINKLVSPALSENNGSIFVEMTSTGNKIALNMNVQVIAGHRKSSIHQFWEELCQIENYLNVRDGMKPECTFSSIISEKTICITEIKSMISELVNTPSYFTKTTSEEFKINLSNLRQESLLDKLWKILILCKTTSDLLDCLHFLFEVLSESQTRVHLASDDCTTLAQFIKGILEGTFAVLPTLTQLQSLELLIELGLDKLKKDYLVIVKCFYNLAEDEFLRKWTALKEENTVKSRLTINYNSATSGSKNNRIRLYYLHCLHVFSEFVFIHREHLLLLSYDSSDDFFKNVLKNFVENIGTMNINENLKESKVYEVSFCLEPIDEEIIKRKTPVSWTVQMMSMLQSTEVSTIFHFSSSPIFPFFTQDNGKYVGTINVAKLVRYVTEC